MTPSLLFDLDGTLLSSDPLHVSVFIKMFGELGLKIDEPYYFANMHGRHNSAIFGDHFPDEDPAVLSDEKEARFREVLGTSALPMPGAIALIDKAHDQGWATAVVTNAPRINAVAMLKATGLAGRLPHLIIGDECSAGKPDPAPYQDAMAQLGSDPKRTLAFEDSPSGVASAAAAGLHVVAIRSSLDEATLRAAGANQTIQDFNDPALAIALARLKGT
jgi:HAD superfamily hydrolase (TIGR01509 family)